jgi:hypothetical protein
VPHNLESCSQVATPLSIETLGDLRDTRTRAAVARRYVPTWRVIKDACASSLHSIRTEPRVLEALITMCCIERKDPVVYYSGESPQQNDGEGCYLCGKHIQRYVKALFSTAYANSSSMKTDKRADHMHNCFWKLKRAGPSSAEYCFRCNVWFPTMDDFRRHCKDHLQELDMYCGIMRCRGLVAAAGLCPFCLSDAQLDRWGDWHKMLHQFTTAHEFANHLMDHLRSYLGLRVVFCPHPLCAANGGFSVAHLARHLYDDHGILQACGWTEATLQPSSKHVLESQDKPESLVQANSDNQDDSTCPGTGQTQGSRDTRLSQDAQNYLISQLSPPDSLNHTHKGLEPLRNDGTLGNNGLAQLHSGPKTLSKRLLRLEKIRLKRQKRRAKNS